MLLLTLCLYSPVEWERQKSCKVTSLNNNSKRKQKGRKQPSLSFVGSEATNRKGPKRRKGCLMSFFLAKATLAWVTVLMQRHRNCLKSSITCFFKTSRRTANYLYLCSTKPITFWTNVRFRHRTGLWTPSYFESFVYGCAKRERRGIGLWQRFLGQRRN